VHVRFRGRFAYVDGELASGEALPLCRLRYNGSARLWGFAIYLASRDGYEDSLLPSGLPVCLARAGDGQEEACPTPQRRCPVTAGGRLPTWSRRFCRRWMCPASPTPFGWLTKRGDAATARWMKPVLLSTAIPVAKLVFVGVTKEYGSSWIFELRLTWANALRRVQRSVFALVAPHDPRYGTAVE